MKNINFDSCHVIIPRSSCAGTPQNTFCIFSKTTSKRMIKQEIIITLRMSTSYIFATTTTTTKSPNIQV